MWLNLQQDDPIRIWRSWLWLLQSTFVTPSTLQWNSDPCRWSIPLHLEYFLHFLKPHQALYFTVVLTHKCAVHSSIQRDMLHSQESGDNWALNIIERFPNVIVYMWQKKFKYRKVHDIQSWWIRYVWFTRIITYLRSICYIRFLCIICNLYQLILYSFNKDRISTWRHEEGNSESSWENSIPQWLQSWSIKREWPTH